MGWAKAISGVILLSSLTSVCSHYFLKYSSSHLNCTQTSENYTLNKDSIITLNKTTTGAKTITHLLHVCLCQTPVLGHALISTQTCHTPCFLSTGPLWPHWSIASAILHIMAHTFISITIIIEAQGLIYGLVFFPMHSLVHWPLLHQTV